MTTLGGTEPSIPLEANSTCNEHASPFSTHLIPESPKHRLLSAECRDRAPLPGRNGSLQADVSTPRTSYTESTEFAVSRNLYACRYCRRLRPAKHFADRMLCRGRGRRGQDARRRFCIQCGLAPRGECGEARYGRGAEIWIQGVLYVVCKDCRRFAQGRPGLDTPRCWWCWEKGFCRPRPCS
ncbi:hypothetical protein ASPSYDRAFT_657383 [Aspergillus sydowii CBS 593.65]|uniref:Uncharacterized protein n=1 Tax=Aspergillus sydowii CBS 593.65 TaxID=1036612 RepID=A0A1L9TTC2_9EURO|nr:uncharacterized protein ASPSYDRAFT_657383 [Aspergillus sydowii CBS 593.65]OJJ62652.1 hypothetical protein ASPSYDRAFT_657383 [Aspergillus sydowii CBS 593.65]